MIHEPLVDDKSPAYFFLCRLWKCVWIKRGHEWDLMKSRLLSVGAATARESGFINPGTGS